jgi:hypothetical protein
LLYGRVGRTLLSGLGRALEGKKVWLGDYNHPPMTKNKAGQEWPAYFEVKILASRSNGLAAAFACANTDAII